MDSDDEIEETKLNPNWDEKEPGKEMAEQAFRQTKKVSKKYDQMIEELTIKADSGDRAAQMDLALKFATSADAENKPKMFKYFKMAADQGHKMAYFNVARCYHKGCGTEANLELAFHYYKLSADKKCGNAQYIVSLFLKEGIGGCEKNLEESQKYLEKAQKQGYIIPFVAPVVEEEEQSLDELMKEKEPELMW